MLVLHSQGRCDGGEYISLAAIGSAQCFSNLVEEGEEKECFLNTEGKSIMCTVFLCYCNIECMVNVRCLIRVGRTVKFIGSMKECLPRLFFFSSFER